MHTLVSGGAGFIGSNLVDALVARGDQVTVIDNLSTGRESNLEEALARGAQLNVLDIREPADVMSAFAHAKPEVVFHLAAQIDVRRSLLEPAWDASVNVQGTINMLEAAREHATKRFINTSTGGAIYGEAELLPTPETALPLPEAAYGQSKHAAEGYCRLYSRLYNLSTVSLRYGNVYGPRQDPLGEAGVVAIFCGRLRDGAQPTVFGDGTQTRDYVYVADIVEANLAAADRGDAGGPINIGTSRQTSVLKLIEVLAERAGPEVNFEPQFEPARLGEVKRSCLEVTLARSVLGWEPRTDLASGLEQTLDATLSALSR